MTYPSPVRAAVEAYLSVQYPNQSVPLAYRELLEEAWGDVTVDLPPLEQWSADRFYEQEPA